MPSQVIDDVEVHVEGEGAETIVMVHGWPDTYRLWDSAVAALKDRYRCVRFTLPGFDAAKPRVSMKRSAAAVREIRIDPKPSTMLAQVRRFGAR